MIWVAGNLFYKTTKESVARSSQCIHIYHKNTRNTCTVNAMHVFHYIMLALKLKTWFPLDPVLQNFQWKLILIINT